MSISIAPMMDWTTRHCRYFHRLLAPHARLYTEMVTTGALIHGDRARHLDFDLAEHPIALQLGGSDPQELATCARMGADWGYDEINLNCGCPSDRVQQGRFGACLMNEPKLVAACVAAMRERLPDHIPVTIKCRIGVDDCDDEPFLDEFVRVVKEAGATMFMIHARKAWLKGLSPKENREVPPLRYDVAAGIKALYPDLTIILNGGLTTQDQVRDALKIFDGVMIGRAAYENPYFLAELEQMQHGTALPARADIARAMIPYIAGARANNLALPINAITRHMLGLYHGQQGARTWRRILTEGAQDPNVNEHLIERALGAVERQAA